jgi:prepilin signal peptidase PulO-like enzyme (type II secretory pathway)
MSEADFLLLLKILSGFFAGAVMGSFITMLSYRLPRGLSIVGPRSFCPFCRKTLRIRDLVPLFSYAASRGRCGQCGAAIGPRYFLIELVSTLVFIPLFLIAGFTFLTAFLALSFVAFFTALLIRLKI